MTDAGFVSSTPSASTGVLVIKSDSESLLCPFFGKCDGVLLLNPDDGSRKFHRHDGTSAKALCDLVLELKPRLLICGFIDEPEKQTLRAAGIDVRLGSCSCSIDELVTSISSMPKA